MLYELQLRRRSRKVTESCKQLHNDYVTVKEDAKVAQKHVTDFSAPCSHSVKMDFITKANTKNFRTIGLYFLVTGYVQKFNNLRYAAVWFDQALQTIIASNARCEASDCIFQVGWHFRSYISIAIYLISCPHKSLWKSSYLNQSFNHTLMRHHCFLKIQIVDQKWFVYR